MLPMLFDRLTALGHGSLVERLVRELNVPAPSSGPVRETTVPLDVYHALCERAADAVGDPMLGLHVAIEGPRGSYGVIEYAARATPTVREAILRAEKYLPLLSEVIDLSARMEGAESAAIIHRVPSHPHGAGRHGNEYALATFVRFGRELTGERLAPDAVAFMHPAPGVEERAHLARYFGTPNLHFGQIENRIVFGAQVLALPIPGHDGALLRVLDQHAEGGLPAPRASEPIPGLRRALEAALETGPTLEDISASLRASPRTLQRRLRDAGTSFQDEVDRIREEQATRLLQESELSVYEIALRLGYAEQGAFERAFRRWRSMSPKQFRIASRG